MGKKKECAKVKKILDENPQVKFQGTKTLFWHTTYGDVAINERTFIINGQLVRPFSTSAEVACRSYSPLLQRRISDFGSDKSFGKAVEKMNEHYGIVVPESSIRLITQKHGENLEASDTVVSEHTGVRVTQVVVQTKNTYSRLERSPFKFKLCTRNDKTCF